MCFGPVVPNGYGVCYNPMNDHINFAVSAFNSCKETAAAQLAQAVVDVLLDMRTLLEQAQRAKLWGSNRTFPEMKQMLQWDRRFVWFIMHFKWDWISESYCPPHFKWCYDVTKKINKIKKIIITEWVKHMFTAWKCNCLVVLTGYFTITWSPDQTENQQVCDWFNQKMKTLWIFKKNPKKPKTWSHRLFSELFKTIINEDCSLSDNNIYL